MESEASSKNAFAYMKQALGHLSSAQPSRENSLAITKLEEAIMWNNKDRTIKGNLKPTDTHVEVNRNAS